MEVARLSHRQFMDNVCARRKYLVTDKELNDCATELLGVCKYHLSPGYILAIANFANAFYIANTSKTHKSRGFLIGDIDDKTKRAFIYTLCSANGNGIGTMLVDAFEAEAIKNGVKIIELESIPSAKGFWIKRGFSEPLRTDSKTRFARILKFVESLFKKPKCIRMKKVYSLVKK